MTTYLLLHGAGHDGWCWHAVADLLSARGHRVVAPDLPCDDPGAGLEEYARAATRAVGSPDAPLVVVGHSLGALTAVVVADRLPTTRLVLVAGIVGVPGRSLADLAETDADRDLPLGDGAFTSDELGRFRFTVVGAERVLYPDCEPDVVEEACRHLRPQRSLWTETLPVERWPDTRIDSVVCADDRVVRPAWSRRVARERLGVEPVELPGGHSPMLARPADLAAVLLQP